MALLLSDLANALGADVQGDATLTVDRPAEPLAATDRDLALAVSYRYLDALGQTKARTALVWADCDWQSFGLQAAILVERPRLAMAKLTQAFDKVERQSGVSANGEIASSATIGDGCWIGSFSTIGADVAIGANSQINSHVSIAEGARIGAGCILHPGVRIGRNVVIGDNVILHPNVVIGADGFSFVTEGPSNEERAFATLGKTPLDPPEDAIRHRIHSLGSVAIGDDVEIGANSTVDAGTIRPTQLGRGTKIDNLVQVGHNVIVGEDCVLCAQTAIAGSSVIGDRTVLGGKSGVKDNITIGSDVVLGGAAIALSNVSNGRFMMGYPAFDMPEHRKQQKGLKALPDLLRQLRER